MKRSPSGAAETTPDKYTKASAKHRYGEVAKRNTDTVKSLTIRRHCVTIGSRLLCYTLVSLHSFADLLHYYYIIL